MAELSYIQVIKDGELMNIYPSAIFIGNSEILLENLHKVVILARDIPGKVVSAVTYEGVQEIKDFKKLLIYWKTVRNVTLRDDTSFSYPCGYRDRYRG